jgi:Histidine kinase
MTDASISKTTKAATEAEAYEIAKSLPPHLLEPWRTKRGAVKATLWSSGLSLVLYFWLILAQKGGTSIELWKILTVTGTVLVSSATYNTLAWWRIQHLRVEPTLGSAIVSLLQFTAGLPGVLLLLSNVAFQIATGRSGDSRFLLGGAWHFVFLVIFTGVFLALFALIYLLYRHTRLSISDPDREQRLAQHSENFSLRTENVLKKMPFVRQLYAYLTIEQQVAAQTQLLDLWAARNIAALVFRDTMSAAILLTFVLALMWFVVTHDGEVFKIASLPYLRVFLALAITMGAGHLALAFLRRYFPWVQHVMLAYVLPLVVVQIAGFSASVLLVRGDFPAGLPKVTVFNYLLLANAYAFLSLMATLLKRFRRITEARNIAATQKSAIAESERARALAELKSLQAQIEPHFIYNTLANLQSLIRQEMPPSPDGKTSASDVMTGYLIDYLRARTLTMRDTVAPLSKEIEMTESYLRLMQIRMGERLNYTVDIADAARDVPIPPLSVMSLVENSIKHGLEPKRGSGSIAIAAVIEQDNLRVTIADTGRGFSVDASGAGVGLSNLKERLALMYGGNAELALRENSPTGVIATLTVPINLPLTTNPNITSI